VSLGRSVDHWTIEIGSRRLAFRRRFAFTNPKHQIAQMSDAFRQMPIDQEEYEISTDPARLDLGAIIRLLRTTY
jgi:hypothetical protein